MPQRVWNGTAWVPIKSQRVWDGTAWVEAKFQKAWDGDSWEYVWVPPTTVTVSVPYSWVLSGQSGQNPASASPSVIQPRVFTVTLSKPLSVRRVSLQLSHQGGAWTEYAGWDNPTQEVLNHSIPFSTTGAWSFRAVVTQLDGEVVTSASGSITCYKKSLSIGASSTAPTVGSTVTFSFACHDDCAPGQSGQGLWYQTGGGGWTYYSDPGTNASWPIGADYAVHNWLYQETFPDGSILNSNSVAVDPVPAIPTHFHEVVPSGGDIQGAMDRAYNWFMANRAAPVNFDDENSMACVQLTSGGTYSLNGPLYQRRGVRLDMTGAVVQASDSNMTHLFRGDNNGGGFYQNPHYDWQIIGGTFDGRWRAGIMSIVHTSRFRVNGVTFKDIGGKKHMLEINSSGGSRNDNAYAIEVLNCTFRMTNKQSLNGEPRRTEDEAVQLDYAWTGAAAGNTDDGTNTNNVLIRGCDFSKLPRAIGGHHWEQDSQANPDGTSWPTGYHSNVLIDACTFTDIDPYAWGDGVPNPEYSEGAVRAYAWNYMIVQGCIFLRCLSCVNIYVPVGTNGSPRGNPSYFIIRGNTFDSCGKIGSANYHNVSGSAHANTNRRIERVLVEDNQVTGNWTTTGYVIGVDDTTGSLPGVSEGAHYRRNVFKPSNLTVAEEKAVNKYRAQNATNATGVAIYDNTVSDGSVNNS